MDSNILFLAAVLAWFLLNQLMARKRRQAGAPQAPRQRVEEPDGDFADALEEIRHALGMGEAAPHTEPHAPVPHAPAPWTSVPTPWTTPPEPRTASPAPRTSASVPPTTTPAPSRFPQVATTPSRTYDDSFGAEAPRVVRMGAGAARSNDPYGFREPLKSPARKAPGTVPVAEPAHLAVRRLRSPETLREAFVLKEILGPPRAHRRSIR